MSELNFEEAVHTLRWVVKTPESSPGSLGLRPGVDQTAFIKEIKSSLRVVAKQIFLDSPTQHFTHRDIAPYFSDDLWETTRKNHAMALRLKRFHQYEDDSNGGWKMVDKRGEVAERDDLILELFLKPFTEAYPASERYNSGIEPYNPFSIYSYMEFTHPTKNVVRLSSHFSLLEGKHAGGEYKFGGFFDDRKVARPRVSNIGSGFSVSTDDFVEKPTAGRYRYLWQGLRWMCANLLLWDSNQIIVPEDLDKIITTLRIPTLRAD